MIVNNLEKTNNIVITKFDRKRFESQSVRAELSKAAIEVCLACAGTHYIKSTSIYLFNVRAAHLIARAQHA